MNLEFDAEKVSVTAREIHSDNIPPYFHIKIEGAFMDEILDNFDVQDIISHYPSLDELREALDEHFCRAGR